jgi:hypothetical protein
VDTLDDFSVKITFSIYKLGGLVVIVLDDKGSSIFEITIRLLSGMCY